MSSSTSASTMTVGGAFTRDRMTTTASSSPLPTAHDSSRYRSLLFDLTMNVIPRRKKAVKGRFDKYDTARRDYISNVALLKLDIGKFPSDGLWILRTVSLSPWPGKGSGSY
jgi:hypothetical protein